MYKSIAVPTDLAHVESLQKALNVAADLGNHYGATVTLVGVTVSTPTAAAHSPEEYARKLEKFAEQQGTQLGLSLASHCVASADVAIDLEKALDKAVHAIGADLVVMASHVPGFRDHFFRNHTGTLATQTDLSVLIVR